MEHLKKTARLLDYLCVALVVVLMVSTLASVGMGIYSAVTKNGYSGLPYVEISGVHLELDKVQQEQVNFGKLYLISDALMVLYALIATAGIHLIRRILRPMKEGRPFAEPISRNLRNLGLLSLAMCAVYVLYDLLGKPLLARVLMVPGTTSVYVAHNINPLVFLIPALLFLLSYIFCYGETLQQLSDETV